MTEQTNAELNAENRKWVRLHQANSHQAEATRRMTRVLDALEAADQLAEIRGETIRTYERENADWERRAHIAERKAAEYAAVVEKVRAWTEEPGDADEIAFADLNSILATAPADALRERDAEKWDEGAEMGHRLYAESMHIIEARNPYREEQD